jgi:signal transduction histidine kinase
VSWQEPAAPTPPAPRAAPPPGAPWRAALLVLPLVLLALAPGLPPLPAGWYVPLHAALELSVIAVAFAAFAVQWYAAGALKVSAARSIGPAMLVAGAFEALHLAAFPGMPGFAGPASTERGIYYWLLARLWTVAPLLWIARPRPRPDRPRVGRGLNLSLQLAAFAALVALELALPRDRALFFVQGQGLTPLKVAIEWALVAAALAGAGLHWRAHRRTGARSPQRLALALGAAALTSASLSLYGHPYEPIHVLGHVYLVVAFGFVFEALFVAGVARPYRELEALRSHVQNELVVTIERLERTQAEREDLLRAVTHDLRNPLQVVLLQSERLERLDDRAAVARAARNVRAAGRRMERLIRDLADTARLGSGAPLPLERRPVALRPFVSRLLEHSDGVLDAARVTNAVPEGLPPLDADPDRLDRILVNLVGNALKYTQGAVTVAAEAADGAVRVLVKDQGPGLSPEARARVFDRWYRAGARDREGLGLGLHIVRGLVEAHGGRVGVESRPGEGSTFSFTFPVAPAAAPA